MECTIYRGISLMCIYVVGIVFAKVLNQRVKILTGEKAMNEKGGFRVGKGCVYISGFVVRQVEKTLQKDRKVYMSSVDLEKAYNNVSRDEL